MGTIQEFRLGVYNSGVAANHVRLYVGSSVKLPSDLYRDAVRHRFRITAVVVLVVDVVYVQEAGVYQSITINEISNQTRANQSVHLPSFTLRFVGPPIR